MPTSEQDLYTKANRLKGSLVDFMNLLSDIQRGQSPGGISFSGDKIASRKQALKANVAAVDAAWADLKASIQVW